MADDTISTREAILDSARQQFFANGFDGARLQAISDPVGATKAMIHYYFNTKKELFEHIYIQAVNHSFGQLSEVINREDSLFLIIDALVEHCLENAEKHSDELIFVITESSRQTDWLMPIFENEVKLELNTISEKLHKAASNYEIADVEAADLLLNIFSLCQYPVLASPIHQSLFKVKKEDQQRADRKGVILDTILNWLTA